MAFFKVFVTALVAIGRTREAKTAISALLCHDPSICWCRELTGLIERVGQLRREARQHMEDNDPVAAETLLTEAIVAFLQARSFCYCSWHLHLAFLPLCGFGFIRIDPITGTNTDHYRYIYGIVIDGVVVLNRCFDWASQVQPCNNSGGLVSGCSRCS